MTGLWDYANALYAEPGVAEACLALQDRRNADVNVLLYCCWHATTGRGRLVDEDLHALLHAVRDWRSEVVEPLRAVRRHMKPDPRPDAQALRERLKAAELEAECIELGMLEAEAIPLIDGDRTAAAMRENAAGALEAYIAIIGTGITDDDRADLARLLDAAFADLRSPAPAR